MRTLFRRLVLLTAVWLLSAGASWAQVQTGSILVKSMDEQGGVVPGATATISSPVLGSGTQTGVTDAGGVYRFVSLPPGTYAIKIERLRFQTTFEGSSPASGIRPDDITMKVAASPETMTVKESHRSSTPPTRT
jgi:hypothetical protein